MIEILNIHIDSIISNGMIFYKLRLYSDVLRLLLKNRYRNYNQIDNEYNSGKWNRPIHDINFETWQGNYNVTTAGDAVRLMSMNGKLFKGKWNDYVQKYQSQIYDVLEKYKDESIVELGCGLGYLLFNLHHKNFKKLEGYDISENAISLLKEYCQKKNYPINFDLLDLNKPFPEGIIEDKVVFTHTSLEQLKYYIPNVLKNIINGNPKTVINFEVDYHAESFWTRASIRSKDYQNNVVTELRKLENQKKIKIISIKKIPLSLSSLNRPSVIHWTTRL